MGHSIRAIGLSAILLGGIVGAAGLADDGTAGSVQANVTESQAIACMLYRAELDARDREQEVWRRALNAWSDRANGRATPDEVQNYYRMEDRFNQAIDAYNTDNRSHNGRCGGVRITRSVFDAVCTGQDSSWCRSFEWD